jgi:hypothetical protein
MKKMLRQHQAPYKLVTIEKGRVSFENNSQKTTPVICNSVIELILDTGIPEILHGQSHISHDDQLRVISGNMLVLVLFKRELHYIPLNYDSNSYLFIPRFTWHMTMNIGEPVEYQNWLINHRSKTEKDYKSACIKHKLNLDLLEKVFKTMQPQITIL